MLLFFVALLFISLIVNSLISARLGEVAPKVGGVYSEGLVGQPRHINPLLAPANDIDMDLSRIVYAGLLKFDENLNLVPDLAAALPEISPDAKEYTIKLKENLFWHDGKPLTADDLVFTFTAIQNPDYQSPLRLSWNRVTAEKIDELTVKLTTQESSAPFIANLTVGIIPKHIWENIQPGAFGLSQFNLEPVGSGPFQITELQRGRNGEIRSLSMSRFENYHGEGPYLKKLLFKFYETTDDLIRAYHSRDIMGLGYVPFDSSLFLEERSNLEQFLLPLPQYQAVFINRITNPAPLEATQVRLALAKSVDKDRIAGEVFGSQVAEAYGPILPGHLGYHEEIPGADMNIYDLEKAKTLLDEAGWKLDETIGFRKDELDRIITLRLATNNFPPNVRVAELLKEMWESIGIQIILNIETVADLDENYIRSRNYELLLFSENVGADPDPYPFWHSSQLRDPRLNLSTFSNTQADRLLVEARANISPEERAAKYRQFQEIFVGDIPAIFIGRSVFVYNISTSIKGLKLSTVVTPSDRFANIADWHIETKRVRE